MKFYQVVSQFDYFKFLEQVNIDLQDGWECQGGIFSAPIRDNPDGKQGTVYRQAMIKTMSLNDYEALPDHAKYPKYGE